jgi:hypothetical protein
VVKIRKGNAMNISFRTGSQNLNRVRIVGLVALAALVGGCVGGAPAKPTADGGGGSGGSGGRGGSGGSAGATAGTGGAAGGSTGTAGGGAGTTGSGGTTGTGGAAGGSTGTAGATTGAAGSTGTGGAAAGSTGTAGSAGASATDGGLDGAAGSSGDGAVDGGSQGIFYAIDNNNQFGTLDPRTGVFAQTGILTGIIGGLSGSISRLPGGPLYGEQSNQDLVIIDPVSVTSTIVGNTGNGIYGIRFRQDGVLFATSISDLYTINRTTAVATHIGSLGTPGGGFVDLAFDASGNLFFQHSPDAPGTLYSVNTSSGFATAIGPIGFEVAAMDFAQGTMYGFTTDSRIITINTATGAGTVLVSETPQGVKVYAVTPTTGE